MKLPTLALLLATARAADVPPIKKVESSESPLPETAGDVQAPLIRKAKSSKIPMAKSAKIPMAKSAKIPMAKSAKKPSEDVVERPDDLDAPSLELPALAPYDFEAVESERRLVANDGICGADNRSRASYKAVGIFYHGSDHACKCTAFLIGEDIFLTSSGCLQGYWGGAVGRLVEGCPVDDESEVHFNFNGQYASVDRQFLVDLDSFKSYPRDQQGQAWAAGRLKNNIFTGETAGATVGNNGFELGYVPPETAKASVTLVGYGNGRSRQEKGTGNMEDKYVPGFDLVYFKADAGDGFGGPLIDTRPNEANKGKVVGIYNSGRCKYGDSNFATPIDSNSLRSYVKCLQDAVPGGPWVDQFSNKGCDWVAENPWSRCRRWSGLKRHGGRKATKACIRACCGVGYT